MSHLPFPSRFSPSTIPLTTFNGMTTVDGSHQPVELQKTRDNLLIDSGTGTRLDLYGNRHWAKPLLLRSVGETVSALLGSSIQSQRMSIDSVFTVSEVKTVLAPEAQDKIESILKHGHARHHDDVESIYHNLKQLILFGNNRRTRLVLEKLLNPYRLTCQWYPDKGFVVEALSNNTLANPIGTNSTAISTESVQVDVANYPVPLIIDWVRGQLEIQNPQGASDILFNYFSSDPEKRGTYLVKIMAQVWPILTREERGRILGHTRIENLIDILKIGYSLWYDEVYTATQRLAILRLASALTHHASDEDRETSITWLGNVLNTLLRQEETKKIGEWLLLNAIYEADMSTSRIFTLAYESIPDKPNHWTTVEDLYKLSRVSCVGDSKEITEREQIYTAMHTLQSRDARYQKFRAADFLSQMLCSKTPLPIEIKEKMAQAILNIEDELKGEDGLNSIVMQLNTAYHDFDEPLSTKCLHFIIRNGSENSLFIFYSTSKLRKLIQTKSSMSQIALEKLVVEYSSMPVGSDRILSDLDLSGLDLRVLNFCDANLSGCRFEGALISLNTFSHTKAKKTRIDSVALRSLKGCGVTDFRGFEFVASEYNPEDLRGIQIDYSQYLQLKASGVTRFMEVIFDDADMREQDLMDVVFEGCRFENTEWGNTKINAVALRSLKGCGVADFRGFEFVTSEYTPEDLRGIQIDYSQYLQLKASGVTRFVEVIFDDVDMREQDLMDVVFEGCRFENTKWGNTKINAVALRSLKGCGVADFRGFEFVTSEYTPEDLRGIQIDYSQYLQLKASSVTRFVEVIFDDVDMREQDLMDVVFEGCRFENTKWGNTKINAVALRSLKGCGVADFRGFEFVTSEYNPEDPRGIQIDYNQYLQLKASGVTKFVEVIFDDADMREQDLMDVVFEGCRFENTKWGNTKINAVALRSLKGCGVADFRGFEFVTSEYTPEDLRGIQIKQNQYKQLIFSGVKRFAGVNFASAGMRYQDLTDVVFEGCRFENTEWGKTKINAVALRSLKGCGVTDFRGFEFVRSQYNPEDLRGIQINYSQYLQLKASGVTRFVEVIFDDADMREQDLTDVVFEGCRFENTKWGNTKIDAVALRSLKTCGVINTLDFIFPNYTNFGTDLDEIKLGLENFTYLYKQGKTLFTQINLEYINGQLKKFIENNDINALITLLEKLEGFHLLPNIQEIINYLSPRREEKIEHFYYANPNEVAKAEKDVRKAKEELAKYPYDSIYRKALVDAEYTLAQLQKAGRRVQFQIVSNKKIVTIIDQYNRLKLLDNTPQQPIIPTASKHLLVSGQYYVMTAEQVRNFLSNNPGTDATFIMLH